MSAYIYWLLACIMIINCLNAFNIKMPKVNVADSLISLSLPANTSVSIETVCFYIEVNMSCPGEFVQAKKSSVDSTWTAKYDFKAKLIQNAIFRVSTMVELNSTASGNGEKILTKIANYKIDSQGKLQNVLKAQINNEILAKCSKERKLLANCMTVETVLKDDKQPKNINDLIFDATFNNGYNLAKYWKHEIRSLSETDSKEFVAFIKSDENINITNNQLYINAHKNDKKSYGFDGCTSKLLSYDKNYDIECERQNEHLGRPWAPVLSAKVHTLDTFCFKYGRIEFSAKMPKGDWFFPYILLQPKNTFTEETKSPQIRLGYARGNDEVDLKNRTFEINSKALFGSVLYWENEDPKEIFGSRISHTPYNEDFHNYTVIWHRDRIIYKVDGIKYADIRDEDYLKHFQTECFIVLGLTVNGITNFPNEDIVESQKTFCNSESHAANKLFESLNNGTSSSLIVKYIRVFSTYNGEN